MVGALFIYTIALLKELSDMFSYLCIDNFSIIFFGNGGFVLTRPS